MTNDEAVLFLKGDVIALKIELYDDLTDSMRNAIEQRLNAEYIAIYAIEKQMPKKPKITHHEYLHNGEEKTVDLTHCPICFEHMKSYFDSLLNKGTAHCHRCGQAIDWSDAE